jgi:hypothetical protein
MFLAAPGEQDQIERQDSYFLFPGLATCVFACAMRCEPQAVVAVRQN